MSVSPIPKGYHTVTPYLLVEDADEFMNFLKDAFGAVSSVCVRDNEDRTTHGEVRIGDSAVMIGGKKDIPPNNTMIYLYVEDVDAVYQQALNAGAESLMAPADQFYGDRNAGVADPYGNKWWIATHIEDVSPAELEKRTKANYAQ